MSCATAKAQCRVMGSYHAGIALPGALLLLHHAGSAILIYFGKVES